MNKFPKMTNNKFIRNFNEHYHYYTNEGVEYESHRNR